ncbi:Ig-like domain-containing protein [Pontivivens ytuae]|uniref:VCBS domain-containing protein n=1 Tax=Pontivivens ytuae TaxID=2789856 RepID=A0A7S9QDZ1_9RHOB|nr:Ig-like domain-containing protein [Pontivivens ytuae]QPH54862.1 VCBS domain-containing protein [Pontivivens ytuae]
MAIGDTTTIQAEHMNLSGGYQTASAHGYTYIENRSSNEGVAETVYDGEAGVYDLDLNVFDENDGEAVVGVYVNGELIDTITFDADSSGGYVRNTSTTYTLEGVELEPGDVIALVGLRDDGEMARIDSVDLTMTAELPGADGPVTTVEITNETFTNGAEGWSDNSTDQDGGFSDMLGRFSGSDGVVATEKTFDVPSGAESVTISFDFLRIDSWDGEEFIVTINGQQISLGEFWAGNAGDRSGEAGDVSWTLVENGDASQIGFWDGKSWTTDQVLTVTMTIDNPGDSLSLGFGSTLNQSLRDESFGIDNLNITAEVVGDPAELADDAYATDEDTGVTGNLLDNDTGVSEINSLSVGEMGEEIQVTTANGYTGTLVVNADGTFSYTPGPDADAMGEGEADSFTFEYGITSTTSTSETHTIDFEQFCRGEVITDQIDGVTISVWARNPNHNEGVDEAMIFDTDNPTGGDSDLATDDQGNVLIISEDNQSWNPDDNARGGSFTLDFDEPSTVEQLTWVDIDHGETNKIKFYDAAGNLITEMDGLTTGNGGQGTQQFNVDGVSKMVIEMSGSGAIDDIVYATGEEVTTTDTATVTIDIAGTADAAPVVTVDAVDDAYTVTEDEGAGDVEGNVLDNDSRSDGAEPGPVVQVNGQAGNVGEWIDLTEGGRVMINADGTIDFDANGDYEYLNEGESTQVQLDYSIEGPIDPDSLTQQNILFVVDKSGSTGDQFAGTAVGDLNGDGVSNTILDAQIASYQALSAQIAALGYPADKINIGLVVFDGSRPGGDTGGNVTGDAQILGTFQPGSSDLSDALASIQDGGWTNFESALFDANDWYASVDAQTTDNNVMYFLSDGANNTGSGFGDGNPGAGVLEQVQALSSDYNTKNVAVGVGSNAVLEQLNDIDNTDGAEIVTTTDGLTAALLEGFEFSDPATDTATVTITITGLDDNLPPMVEMQEATTDENTPVYGDLLDGATDPDGDVVTLLSIDIGEIGQPIQIVTDGGRNGTLTVTADGLFEFVPDGIDLDLGETDTFSFGFTGTDGELTDSNIAKITITGLNDGPSAKAQFASTDEAAADGTPNSVSGDLLDGASDADGDTITLKEISVGEIGEEISIVTDGGKTGTLVVNPDGTFTFTSTDSSMDVNETDTYTFEFTVSSSGGTTEQTDTQTATITINGLNDAPVAIDQAVETNEQNDQGLENSVSGDLLNGASDVDGDVVSLSSTSIGAVGETVSVTTDGGKTGDLTINADGTFTFTSTDESLDKGETDTLTFTFTVESSGGTTVQTDEATAVVTINGVNVAPVAVDYAGTISEQNTEGLVSEITGNLLDGATDQDGDAVSLFSTTLGAIGETVEVTTSNGKTALLTVNADGTFTLVSTDDSMDLTETDTVEFDFTVVSSGGVTDQFDTKSATITIEGVNVGPVAEDKVYDVFEANAEGLESSVSGDLLEAATDADGDAIALKSTTLGTIGERVAVVTDGGRDGFLTINADGTFTFESASDDLDLGQSDTITFDFEVVSSGGAVEQTDTKTATININGVNVPPVAVDKAATINEDEKAQFNLLVDASDADGDEVTLMGISDGLVVSDGAIVRNDVITDGGRTGTLTVLSDGRVIFDPSVEMAEDMNTGDTDTFTFTFTVASSDGGVVQTDTKTATITILGEDENNPPQATGEVLTINEDEIASSEIFGDTPLATDPDAGDSLDLIEINGQAFTAGSEITLTSQENNYDGTLVVNADGTFSFDPGDSFLALNQGETETVTFDYTVADQAGETASATITIEVNGLSDEPGADVNVIFLIDASTSMFVNNSNATVDRNVDGSYSSIDLAIGTANAVAEGAFLVYDLFEPDLSLETSFYAYGDLVDQVNMPEDIQIARGDGSDLGAALEYLQTQLDPNARNHIYILTDSYTTDTGAQEAYDALTADWNADIEAIAIGSDGGTLTALEGLDADDVVSQVAKELDIIAVSLDEEIALEDDLFALT